MYRQNDDFWLMTLQLYSDLYFGHTSNEQAVSQSADTPVYWYLYNYVYENGNVDELYGIKSDDAYECSFTAIPSM